MQKTCAIKRYLFEQGPQIHIRITERSKKRKNKPNQEKKMNRKAHTRWDRFDGWYNSIARFAYVFIPFHSRYGYEYGYIILPFVLYFSLQIFKYFISLSSVAVQICIPYVWILSIFPSRSFVLLYLHSSVASFFSFASFVFPSLFTHFFI